MIVKVTLADEVPAPFVAVITKTVVLSDAFGVPLIRQVVGLSIAQAGKCGELVQLVMPAPFEESVGVMLSGVPTTPVVPTAPAKLKFGADGGGVLMSFAQEASKINADRKNADEPIRTTASLSD